MLPHVLPILPMVWLVAGICEVLGVYMQNILYHSLPLLSITTVVIHDR